MPWGKVAGGWKKDVCHSLQIMRREASDSVAICFSHSSNTIREGFVENVVCLGISRKQRLASPIILARFGFFFLFRCGAITEWPGVYRVSRLGGVSEHLGQLRMQFHGVAKFPDFCQSWCGQRGRDVTLYMPQSAHTV